MTNIEFDRAINVFVNGFAFTRSFTYPYQAETLSDRVVVLRDAPRKRGDYRSEEFVVSGVPIAELDALMRATTRGRFNACYLLPNGEPDNELRADFKTLGYRLVATEALMIHRLNDLAPSAATTVYSIMRVRTEEQAERLAKAARQRQILPKYLTAEPAPMRQYVALANDTPIGWVGSVVVGEYTWCTSMFVEPAHRRKGIARDLLNRMLTDDREAGATANILLASHTGSKLYPTVGYESLGTLYMFTPPKEQPVKDNG